MAMKREAAQEKVNKAMGMLDYKQQMLNAERDFLEKTMFDREIYDPSKHGPLEDYLARERGDISKGGGK
jgi:hypothetical protein